ncbi:MAG: insulinase family protein [Cytophagales bacterium]|nr:insulinase family protein [Bernardetiaceae bacterium]MDW8205768.1 insulinase family protein [Cytophagales bacterium]
MKKTLLFSFLSWALVMVAYSQLNNYEWKTGKTGKYTYRYVTNDPFGARFYKLDNGLTVVLSINRREPRIYTMMTTRAGAVNDPRTDTGLAHYLEHLMFKGTSKFGTTDWEKEKVLLAKIEDLYDEYGKTTDTAKRAAIYREIDRVSNEAAKLAIANEYDKLMSAMGSQGTNAFTSYEYTSYLENIPANALDRYLAVQAERFQNPVFRIFHTELETVYEEKNISLDNDGRKAGEALYAALFEKYHLNKSVLGDQEHLKNPNPRRIRKFYETYYVPNNMALILVGDLNPEEVMPKVEKAFAWMKSKPVEDYKAEPEKEITQPIVREVFGPTPENIILGFRMPGLLDRRASLLLTVANEIMSNRGAGLLDLNLNKKQLVQNSFSGVTQTRGYSVWQFGGTPKAGQSLDEVRDLILGQIEKLKKGDFDESFIQAIVNNFKLNYLQQSENNNTRALTIMRSFSLDHANSWDAYLRQIDEMSKVTKKDIVEFVNRYCANNYAIVYKRKGEDKNVMKLAKPPITPVSLNRDAQSAFFKQINAMPMAEMKPVFVNFEKDLQRSKIADKVELLYAQNTDNQLYRLVFRIDGMGTWNNKLLPYAFQYLQFLGTDKYTAEELSKAFYALAANYNTNASGETTSLIISGLQENMEKTLELVQHLLRHCKPDEQAWQALKMRIIKARNDAKLNKQAIMQGLRSYATYGPKNPFNSVMSNEEINAITPQQLVDVLHSILDHPHMVIYYGPKPINEISADIARLMPLPAQFKALPQPVTFTRTPTTKNQVLFADYNMVQAEISWIRVTEPYNPTLTPIVQMFNEYFGGNMSSVVFQSLREAKALAYSTFATYGQPAKKEDYYTLTGYIGTQADKIHDAIQGMNELLTQIPEAQNMFELSRKSLKKTIETERITRDVIVYAYLAAKDLGLEEDVRKATYEALDKFTFDDVKQFHSEKLSGKPYAYCVVASEQKIKLDELSRYGEVKKLSLEEIFGY